MGWTPTIISLTCEIVRFPRNVVKDTVKHLAVSTDSDCGSQTRLTGARDYLRGCTGLWNGVTTAIVELLNVGLLGIQRTVNYFHKQPHWLKLIAILTRLCKCLLYEWAYQNMYCEQFIAANPNEIPQRHSKGTAVIYKDTSGERNWLEHGVGTGAAKCGLGSPQIYGKH